MPEIPFKVNSLTINNIDIIVIDYDPRIFGYDAKINSLLIDNNGYIFRKFGSLNLQWEKIYPYNTTKTLFVNYNIQRDDSILLIDSTSSDINLLLPPVGNKAHLSIKKISKFNKVIINTNSSELIDGNLNLILTSINSSVTLNSDGNNWYIL